MSQGVVTYTGWDDGYENLIRVRPANGVESWYAHLSTVGVQAGERVNAGDRVGAVGSTGNPVFVTEYQPLGSKNWSAIADFIAATSEH